MAINFSRPSNQMLKAIAFLRESQDWVTSDQLAAAVGCAKGTARDYLRGWVKTGVVTVQPRHPGYLYRLTPDWSITPVGQFLDALV